MPSTLPLASLSRSSATQAVQSRPASHSLRAFSVSSSQLLRGDDWMPLWKYEVKGTVNGKPVQFNVDEKGIGSITMTTGGATRKLNRTELKDLEVSLAAYAKAKNFNPPQGITEARIAVAEALAGEAPMRQFQPTTTSDFSKWLGVAGPVGCHGAYGSVTLNTEADTLSLLYQTGGCSRARPMTREELSGLVASLGPVALTSPMGSPNVAVFEAAKRALSKL